jgi:hypothetical protein
LKLSRLFAEYLIQNKKLTLPGIGSFTVDETILKTPEQETAGIRIVPGSVLFHPDKKIAPDQALIEFISKETGKIKPLATSDLESYLELGMQLININKPFILEGIGTLQKNGQNQLEFIQGDAFTGQPELQSKKAGKLFEEEPHPEENLFRTPPQIKSSPRTLVIILLLLAGIAIIAWVVYYFYNQSNNDEADANAETVTNTVKLEIKPDTIVNNVIDSTVALAVPKDSVSGIAASQIQTDPGSFKLVLEIANQKRALKRYAELKEYGHKVQLETPDSQNYKLYIPVTAPLSDSIRHRDSLSRFFGKKVWIETN